MWGLLISRKNLHHYLYASVVKDLITLAWLVFTECSYYTRSFFTILKYFYCPQTKYRRIEYVLLLSSDLISSILVNYIYANTLASVCYYHHCHPNSYSSFQMWITSSGNVPRDFQAEIWSLLLYCKRGF